MWLLVRVPNLSFIPPLKVVPQCPQHLANPAGALHPYAGISGAYWDHSKPGGTQGATCVCAPISATAWLQEISLQVFSAVNLVCSVACLCFDDRSGEITPMGQK